MRHFPLNRISILLVVLQVLVLSLMVTLLGRLWYLQVLSGDHYLAQADNNRVREVKIQAPRGRIVVVGSSNTDMVVRVPDRASGTRSASRRGRITSSSTRGR